MGWSKKNIFTLIELLVVTGIMAVLKNRCQQGFKRLKWRPMSWK